MKQSFYVVTAVVSVLLMSCGSSLSDAEKKTAGQALSALTSNATNPSRLQPDADRIVEDLRAKNRACTPVSETTGANFTYKVECPDSNTYKVTLTSSTEYTATCGTDTFKVKNLAATFTYSFVSSVYSFAVSVKADINSEPLSCTYGASVNVSTGTSTVNDANYSCTYKGADVDKTALQTAACSTR